MSLSVSKRVFSRTLLKRKSLLLRFSTSSRRPKDEEYADIVISGGGMVGGAMAGSLGKCNLHKGKRIILLESAPEKAFTLPKEHSNRVCALSPSSVKLLQSFGAWEEIEAMRCHPVLCMQVWDSCSDSMITFNNDNMTDNLAYMVENDVTQAAVMKALKGMQQRVEVRYGTSAQQIILPDSGGDSKMPYVKIVLSDKTVLKTKLLIGADGMNSTVRKTANFKTINRDYQQHGVVATLTLGDTTVNNTAWQRFLPTGPIAILPVNETQSSLVWTTTKENAQHMKELTSDRFVDAVNDAMWNERDKNELADKALNGLRSLLRNFAQDDGVRQLPPTAIDVVKGTRASFPLSLVHATHYVKPRVALIGDAAHRIHPLAGQGVNLGFGDVSSLTSVLRKAARNGADPGSLTHLLQYETERQRQNVPVMLATDGLQRLYSNNCTPLVVLRSLGLQATHSFPALKRKIIQQASG